MPGFIVIKKQNLAATKATIAALPMVGEVEAFENVDEEGIPSETETEFQMIRVTGDAKFAAWAMEKQGYAKVVKYWG